MIPLLVAFVLGAGLTAFVVWLMNIGQRRNPMPGRHHPEVAKGTRAQVLADDHTMPIDRSLLPEVYR